MQKTETTIRRSRFALGSAALRALLVREAGETAMFDFLRKGARFDRGKSLAAQAIVRSGGRGQLRQWENAETDSLEALNRENMKLAALAFPFEYSPPRAPTGGTRS